MSFLKSFRNSVSRKSSNSKNNTSVVTIGGSSGSFRRKPGNSYSGKENRQEDPSPDGIHRSNTFTINNEDSILVKVKSEPKSTNMFGKLGSLGRKKKTAQQPKPEKSSNSYKSWPYPNEPASVGNDPFGVLYTNNNSNPPTKAETLKKSAIDHGTYRKSKLPTTVKEQLEEIRDVPEQPDEDKFKTVTINSFRKSFRQKFLSANKQAPYNPSWFIEVDPLKTNTKELENDKPRSPEKLIFENENYRPNARSPIRELQQPTPKPRSSVKRNETFRVERESEEPSIRIEIKNSISPHEPSRIVPVGVAKPIPTSIPQSQASNNIIQKTWTEPGRNSNRNLYQTTIQISDNSHYPVPKPRRLDTSVNSNFKRSYTPGGYTKIQINDEPQKENFISSSSPLTSYGMLKNMNNLGNLSPTRANERSRTPTHRQRETSPEMDGRKWNRSPSPISSSGKRKMGAGYTTGTENSARREALNISRITSNARRPLAKAPWR
ncbi:unnamed protein product [Hermetia illucens]|uniref:Uncharacterized protein n=1 Tax=Hermetia illucens TaxID=343691 RepID=A0A7R8UJH1_HERIL|nr:serine/arginine repetitive matrix protein 1 [Hermetia illucens]CAD7081672.1 unnamed protein product [Hermetia illucens]